MKRDHINATFVTNTEEKSQTKYPCRILAQQYIYFAIKKEENVKGLE